MACHCESGILQPGEAISYPVRGLPRREKTADRNDISDFEKAMKETGAGLSYQTRACCLHRPLIILRHRAGAGRTW
jgi:hypothetical protein